MMLAAEFCNLFALGKDELLHIDALLSSQVV